MGLQWLSASQRTRAWFALRARAWLRERGVTTLRHCYLSALRKWTLQTLDLTAERWRQSWAASRFRRCRAEQLEARLAMAVFSVTPEHLSYTNSSYPYDRIEVEVYTLRRSGETLQVVAGDSSGRVLASQALAETDAIEITGRAGRDDQLTIDFTSGGYFPVPFKFTAGSESGFDRLRVIGNDALAARVRAGQIDIGPPAGTSITGHFEGLESLAVTRMRNMDYATGSQADLKVSGVLPVELTPYNVIEGTAAGIALVPLTFSDIPVVTLNEGNTYSDGYRVTIAENGLVASGLTTFHVYGGAGRDEIAFSMLPANGNEFAFAQREPGWIQYSADATGRRIDIASIEAVSLHGHKGDDRFLIRVNQGTPGSVPITVHGLGGHDTLAVIDDGPGDVITVNRQDELTGIVSVKDLAPIAYGGIERLVFLPIDPAKGTGHDHGGRVVIFGNGAVEFNDSLSSATDLNTASQGANPLAIEFPQRIQKTAFDSNATIPADEDWYRFTATKASVVRIGIRFVESRTSGALNLELYDEDGVKIAVGDPTDDGMELLFGAAAGGIYYARVRGATSDIVNTYTIEHEEHDLRLAIEGPEGIIAAGGEIALTYTLSTSSPIPFTNIAVGDGNARSSIPNEGDLDGNGALDAGEIWIYTVPVPVSLGTQTHSARATAIATIHDQPHLLSAFADYDYFGVGLRLTLIDRLPNANSGSAARDEKLEIDGDLLRPRYRVEGFGSGSFSKPMLRDDNDTPDVSDDYDLSYEGDSNNDGNLNSGESWIFEGSRLARARFDDHGKSLLSHPVVTARADYIDGETSTAVVSQHKEEYLSVRLDGLQIQKTIETGTENITRGQTLKLRYELTSDHLTLAKVAVVDDNGTPDDATDDPVVRYLNGDTNSNDLLDPGETWTYEAETVALEGAQTIRSRARGTVMIDGDLIGEAVVLALREVESWVVTSTQESKYLGLVVPSPEVKPETPAGSGADGVRGFAFDGAPVFFPAGSAGVERSKPFLVPVYGASREPDSVQDAATDRPPEMLGEMSQADPIPEYVDDVLVSLATSVVADIEVAELSDAPPEPQKLAALNWDVQALSLPEERKQPAETNSGWARPLAIGGALVASLMLLASLVLLTMSRAKARARGRLETTLWFPPSSPHTPPTSPLTKDRR